MPRPPARPTPEQLRKLVAKLALNERHLASLYMEMDSAINAAVDAKYRCAIKAKIVRSELTITLLKVDVKKLERWFDIDTGSDEEWDDDDGVSVAHEEVITNGDAPVEVCEDPC